MNKYIFTVRNSIKSEPRITQEKVLVEPFTFKLALSLWFLFSVEKEKDKKADKAALKNYEEQLNKLGLTTDKQNYFTKDTFYYNCINKYVKTSDGWCNLKKV